MEQEIPVIEREKLLQMNYMGIDLGHSDILYMAKICKEDDKNYISKKDSSEVFKPAHINFDKYHKSNQFITVNEAEELNSIYNKRVFLFNHLSTNQYYNDTLVNDHILNNHIFKSEWIEQLRQKNAEPTLIQYFERGINDNFANTTTIETYARFINANYSSIIEFHKKSPNRKWIYKSYIAKNNSSVPLLQFRFFKDTVVG